MKRSFFLVLAASHLMGVCLAAGSAFGDLPPESFSVGGFLLNTTTLAEVQERLGAAQIVRTGPQDEADVSVCYVHRTRRKTSYLILESGPMGGFSRITGFRLSSIRPKMSCSQTAEDVAAMATGTGARLGQSVPGFRQAFPVTFQQREAMLAFEGVTRRIATPEEREKLRLRWPNETQDWFDVTTVIRARFLKNSLVDLYVSRIESF